MTKVAVHSPATCSYIGLLGADTIVMLREADKCPGIIFSAVIPATPYPSDAGKLYRALYDDLMKRADNKEVTSEKDSTGKAFADYHHIVCFYNDFSEEIRQVRASGVSYTNICKMI